MDATELQGREGRWSVIRKEGRKEGASGLIYTSTYIETCAQGSPSFSTALARVDN